MSTSVEKIKERLSIVDVVGSYLKLDRAGNNLKAKCPFHNEKTPSFFVSPDRGSYYCFGCGAKGDIFSFVEEFEGIDFMGALKILAERAGIELEKYEPGKVEKKDKLFKLLEESTKFFVGCLQEETIPKEYLKKRGLTEKTIKDWQIGYANDDWHKVSEYLKGKGFTDEEMERAGLIKKGDKGFYDRFRGRIMFPIFDTAGRIIAYSGRTLSKDENTPKYLNSPETPLFNKSKTLYGFHVAKQAIRKFDYAVLVEGQMDLLMCQQAGFTNTVASSGTALTLDHLEILKRMSNRVIMAFDSDSAGAKAAERAWMIAMSAQMEVKVTQIPDGFDPADLILKGLSENGKTGKEDWKILLKNAQNIIDFLLNKVLAEKLDDRKLGIAVREKVLPYVSVVDSEIEKSQYIEKIYEKTGIKIDALWDDLKKIKVVISILNGAKNIEQKEASEYNKLIKINSLERKAVGMILMIESDASKNKLLTFFEDEIKKFLDINFLEKSKILDKNLKNEIIFEAESYYLGFPDDKLKSEFSGLLKGIKEEEYKKELSEIIMEIKKVEKTNDKDKQLALAKRFNDVSKILNSLKINK